METLAEMAMSTPIPRCLPSGEIKPAGKKGLSAGTDKPRHLR